MLKHCFIFAWIYINNRFECLNRGNTEGYDFKGNFSILSGLKCLYFNPWINYFPLVLWQKGDHFRKLEFKGFPTVLNIFFAHHYFHVYSRKQITQLCLVVYGTFPVPRLTVPPSHLPVLLLLRGRAVSVPNPWPGDHASGTGSTPFKCGNYFRSILLLFCSYFCCREENCT